MEDNNKDKKVSEKEKKVEKVEKKKAPEVDLSAELGLDTPSITEAKEKKLNPQMKAKVKTLEGNKRDITHPIGILKEVNVTFGSKYKNGFYKGIQAAQFYITIEQTTNTKSLPPQHSQRFSSFLDRNSTDNEVSKMAFIEDNFNSLMAEIYKTCFNKDKAYIENIEKGSKEEFNKELNKVGFEKGWLTKDENGAIKIVNKPAILNLKYYHLFKALANDLNELIKNADKEEKYAWFIAVAYDKKSYEVLGVQKYYKNERPKFKGEETREYEVASVTNNNAQAITSIDDLPSGLDDVDINI
jgi:hypothetical protein